MLGRQPVIDVADDGRVSDVGERLCFAPQTRARAWLGIRCGPPCFQGDGHTCADIHGFVNRAHPPGRGMTADAIAVGDDVTFAHRYRCTTTTGTPEHACGRRL